MPMLSRVRKVQILKHPNNRSPYWYLRWWEPKPDGKAWRERWKSTKTKIKRDAEKQRRELEREIDSGRRPNDAVSWDDFVTEFLSKHAVRKAGPTIMAYKMCLQAFYKTVKPRHPEDVDIAMLEDFTNARLEKDKIAPATVNKELRHVRATLRWAAARGYISGVPSFANVFVRVDECQPTIIPEADFIEMIKALQATELKLQYRTAEWWRVFLYLAFYLGLRRGELLGLTWGGVRFDNLEVVVRAITSKGRKDRVLPMSSALAKILCEWRDGQEKAQHVVEDPILPWPHDTYRQLYGDWHAIQKAAKIADDEHYVPRNCRSSCASELIAAGIPTVVVKDYLGHASVTTTERYYINTKPAMRATATAREVKVV